VTFDPQVVGRLGRYFAGEAVGFEDVEIDLDWCTAFQRSVADTLRGVPYGEVVTYGELAALAGYPNAQRAAGTFCAHNRLPLVIPCHRVVSAGGLGSYGSLGEGYKRRLLALEGVRF
jgi:methylated-DNA-[protein]-cysteine S-methyltransferase